MGNKAYLIAHEWTLYVFDAAPMCVVLVVLLVFQENVAVEKGGEKVEGESGGESGGR